MSTSRLANEAVAADVRVTRGAFVVDLADDRTLTAEWYPRLRPSERRQQGVIGRGTGIRCRNLDEDISIDGLLPWRKSMSNLWRRLAALPPSSPSVQLTLASLKATVPVTSAGEVCC